jgi:hypothetical protein
VAVPSSVGGQTVTYGVAAANGALDIESADGTATFRYTPQTGTTLANNPLVLTATETDGVIQTITIATSNVVNTAPVITGVQSTLTTITVGADQLTQPDVVITSTDANGDVVIARPVGQTYEYFGVPGSYKLLVPATDASSYSVAADDGHGGTATAVAALPAVHRIDAQTVDVIAVASLGGLTPSLVVDPTAPGSPGSAVITNLGTADGFTTYRVHYGSPGEGVLTDPLVLTYTGGGYTNTTLIQTTQTPWHPTNTAV